MQIGSPLHEVARKRKESHETSCSSISVMDSSFSNSGTLHSPRLSRHREVTARIDRPLVEPLPESGARLLPEPESTRPMSSGWLQAFYPLDEREMRYRSAR